MPVTEINLTQEEGVVCQIFTQTHIITSDDPDDPEAEDEGPTPLEYLAAAVGSSAAISVRRTAEKLGIEVEEIQISVRWRASHRQLMDTTQPVPPHAIQREIRIRVARDINEMERDALLAAAKNCPVDRAWTAQPKIEDALYVLGYAEPDAGEVVE